MKYRSQVRTIATTSYRLRKIWRQVFDFSRTSLSLPELLLWCIRICKHWLLEFLECAYAQGRPKNPVTYNPRYAIHHLVYRSRSNTPTDPHRDTRTYTTIIQTVSDPRGQYLLSFWIFSLNHFCCGGGYRTCLNLIVSYSTFRMSTKPHS